jgi:two-component system LytT family response regulator
LSAYEDRLRIVVADDERPARSYLVAMLGTFEDVETIGEAADGREAIEIIERLKPDLALLDLQMPEVDGLNVVRLIKKNALPLIAFVTAHDEHAVQAFELNAIDYLLKPVERTRLAQTLRRAHDRLELADPPADVRREEDASLQKAIETYERATANAANTTTIAPAYLERLPVRGVGGDITLLSTRTIASVIADGELLHITTTTGERHAINYRLKDLEARLDPARFMRLARGTIANRELIERIAPLPGGTYTVTLKDGQQLSVSRIRSRVLRAELLKM